ncbi:ER membrane protein complex subunit 6-like [Argopecten irradians]|uniref:ER membrane protein complex subunit 6-like n=1 Tax=Argopecten irradians TaxID=31199 RepID=UPI00372405C0
MASGVAVKTKRKGKDNVTAYSELAMRGNAFVLEYCRTSMSALSGAAAGILGLTALYGFAFYFITSIILSLMLYLKAGSAWHKYFVNRRGLFINGLLGGLFTYILVWTFLYGMVHVY